MKLGDKVTLAGREWTVRAFTPAEHQRFDELAAEHDLMRKAARLEALRAARHGTARQKVLEADAKRVQAQLERYFQKDGTLKRGLTEEQRLEALEKAAELDAIEARIDALKREPIEDLLIADEDLTQTREAVIVAFMHPLIAPGLDLADFHASLTDEDVLVLDELVGVGKLRAGLSARDRRQRATLTKLLLSTQSSETGTDSVSSPGPQDAPAKPGKGGRSRKSSTPSKAGSSEPTRPPGQ